MERKHTYSEKEAAELLQRAARLQESVAERDYTPGVSFEELQRIAHEAGIDPKYLDQAVQVQSSEPKQAFFGMVEEYDKVIEGELDPDDFDAILEVFGVGMKRQQMRQVGRSLIGQTTAGLSMVHLEVSSRNGRTRIRGKSTPFIAYFATLHWMGILGIILGASTGESSGAVAGMAVGLTLLIAGLLSFYLLGKASTRSARTLVGKVEERVHELVQPVKPPVSVPNLAQEVHLDVHG